MHQRRKLTLCLVAGVLVLAVSAAAAFGSVNGYDRYKQAVKAAADPRGKPHPSRRRSTWRWTGRKSLPGRAPTPRTGRTVPEPAVPTPGGGGLPGVFHRAGWDAHPVCGGQPPLYPNPCGADRLGRPLLGIQADDEMTQRMVDFAEMALDLTGGGLKNNVVQLAQEAGQTCYQINVSQIQFPSLFNAGLSVLAYYMMGQPDPSYLEYEDYYGLLLPSIRPPLGWRFPRTCRNAMPTETLPPLGTRPTKTC